MIGLTNPLRSLLAVGSGMLLMFVCAFLFDHLAQLPSPVAQAVAGNNPYLGMILAAVAGFGVARIAPDRRFAHALGLVVLFCGICAVQSLNRMSAAPWWAIVFGQVLPVLACGLAIGAGGWLGKCHAELGELRMANAP